MLLQTVLIGLLLITFTGGATALDGYAVDAQTGLRMERYRAPVPQDVPGGITLDTQTAKALHDAKNIVFIDVYPPKGLGPDPMDGSWVTNEKRSTIPGGVWLPEVGRGTLDAEAADYFRRNLKRLSNGDRDTAIAFYCTSDCWQSWNASRRAINWGYTAVHWYPLGTDGWLESGLTLTPVQPVNFFDDTTPIVGFPATARIYLIDQKGEEWDIGYANFEHSDADTYSVNVEIDSPHFEDQFLSMRPFRCLTASAEWFCYLPYPYELTTTVSSDDLTNLEYRLLFIWKSPKSFGIDAWNGVYYTLTKNTDGSIGGKLLQGDLNVLADPPEPFSYPIDLTEFIEEGAKNRLYPALVIRP